MIRLLGLLAGLLLLAGCAQEAPRDTLALTYRGGQVGGDTGTVPVALGSHVRVTLTSDVAEEAHLHGYDVLVAVPAGGTATLEFTADLPGEFALELHHSDTPLATLRVS